jgi:hypothetical protein
MNEPPFSHQRMTLPFYHRLFSISTARIRPDQPAIGTRLIDPAARVLHPGPHPVVSGSAMLGNWLQTVDSRLSDKANVAT